MDYREVYSYQVYFSYYMVDNESNHEDVLIADVTFEDYCSNAAANIIFGDNPSEPSQEVITRGVTNADDQITLLFPTIERVADTVTGEYYLCGNADINVYWERA